MCFICVQSCRPGPCGPSRPTRPHMAGAGLCLESRYGSWHQSALLSRTGLRHLCRHTGMSASTKLGSQYSPKSLFLWPPGDYQLQGSGYSLRRPVVVTSIICHPLWCQCHVIYAGCYCFGAWSFPRPLTRPVPELTARLTGEGA